jgi:phosphate uptake regulator
VDEQRKIQKVGYSTLSVSIPSEFARESGLKAGDSVLVRQEADGSLRLIPSTKESNSSKVTIRADVVVNQELLSKLIIGGYSLGYETIEVVGRNRFDESVVDNVVTTIRRLRGLEVVESGEGRIVAQSFMDPTKFPVDSLIRRLQILVSRSLDNVVDAIQSGTSSRLNEVKRTQEEVDELYWLIVRQLLVALNHREIASLIGIESPLHASGDRVCAKTLEEIGALILDLSEEIARLRGQGIEADRAVLAKINRVARKAQESFNTTVESLLTPDIKLVRAAVDLVQETIELERQVTHELLQTGEYAYSRVILSHFGQLVRYCNIIIEISSNRLLRKSSRVAAVQQL